MGWTLAKDAQQRQVWRCSKYSDLNYAEINNFAEFGQPFSPYEFGFDHRYVPDFKHIIIEMPHAEVMHHGFGGNMTARKFPFVSRFLSDTLRLKFGTYSFDELVQRGVAKKTDRFWGTDLYTQKASGNIHPGDAAYIYGTIAFAMMKRSRFTYTEKVREVSLEIGALDDNWDFSSGQGWIQVLNPLVAATLGPDHYNLEAPIRIRYIGPGRMFVEREYVSPGLWNRLFE